MEKPEFVTIGEPETGFALYSLMTSKSAYPLRDGTKKQSDLKNEMRVTEFEEGPLDPALFEIPPGFKHVDRIERNSSASALAEQTVRSLAPIQGEPDPRGTKPVSKPSVLINLIQALCAIVLGNVAYFFLAPSLPLPRHRPFQFDAGLVVDFMVLPGRLWAYPHCQKVEIGESLTLPTRFS